jgi:hypothetical protein
MAMARALSVITILSTALAAPVFAKDASLDHSSHEQLRHDQLRIHRGLMHHHVQGQYLDQHFRGAYNQRNERFDHNPQFQRNTFQRSTYQPGTGDFRGRDPSRIGGEDPDLHPSAY